MEKTDKSRLTVEERLESAFKHSMVDAKQGLAKQAGIFLISFQKHATLSGLKIMVVDEEAQCNDGIELDFNKLQKKP